MKKMQNSCSVRNSTDMIEKDCNKSSLIQSIDNHDHAAKNGEQNEGTLTGHSGAIA